MIQYLQKRSDAMIGMEEVEHDLEIQEQQQTHQKDLKDQKAICHQLKKEQDTLLRGLDRMEKDKEHVEKKQQEASQDIAQLKEESEELNRTVNGLFAERKERESTLNEKEKKISEYKQKVATLKKFRHVLDYRLREVTELLQPKDQKITAFTAHLHDLESEFEKQLADQRNMETTIERKNQSIRHMTDEQKKLRDAIKSKERIIERFSTDLYNLVNNNGDIREWPREIKRMYHEYVKNQDEHVSKEDQQSMKELDRQMKLMERKIQSLAMKGGRTELACKTDIQRKSHENSLLIHELNELRLEKRGLQDQVKNLELSLRQCQQKLENISNERGMLRSGSSGRLMPIANEPQPPSGRPSGSVPPKPAGRRPPSPGVSSAERRAAGTLRKGATSHMPPEERQRMQNLLLTADLNSQQIQMQKLENKILRDQVQKLLEERQRLFSGAATFDDLPDPTTLPQAPGVSPADPQEEAPATDEEE
jgi:chromosome segregation ATPase